MASRFLPKLRSSRPRGFFREFNYTLFTIATWIPAVIFFNGHVGEVTWINGSSMYPFLNSSYDESLEKDVCWTNKWSPITGLRRGMIVSFRSPSNPETVSIKRIIAVEGDLVFTRAPYPLPTVRIPVNHVWVEGDNKDTNKTLDSNTYGPIPVSLIQGKVTHVLWPWKSFGPIRWQEFRSRARVIKGRPENAPGWD
ncbi:LexA/Signal peptidase [Mollisia scopiformis]|uniref:Mitochondrial inner membrane protease subunit 2 n=1 Tax=Mollisia scopiformis TaxID=149040 RepID=A0A194X3K6_MOLSC|nr:LexA/Signal peptidase [Mollisia scopiformis]KUJ14407.1 LexA/Signal peptidase [Mollisia scopiformis]